MLVLSIEIKYSCLCRLYNALHGIYVIIVYITYPVQFFAAIDILKPILEDRFEKSSLVAAEYGLRAVLVLLTCK